MTESNLIAAALTASVRIVGILPLSATMAVLPFRERTYRGRETTQPHFTKVQWKQCVDQKPAL
jgi:hypothetical protein